MRAIVGRLLTDRFWQAGISEGSKDDFYARVMEKKSTVEGFASTVRGAIRFVRESCYAILYCMSRMDTQFYGFGELPGPLAHSLLADSYNLSAHQLINLLNLVRHLVDNCPVQLREHFLPPILAACFQQMDAKVNSEWMKIEEQQGTKTGGDALTEEMKSESILRQLTYTSVMMVADFLDPARTDRITDPSVPAEVSQGNYPTLRKFCLMQSSIVEPLLVFCTHVIRMRDTRCCGIMLRVFRSIVPEFSSGAADPIPPESTGGNPNDAVANNSNGNNAGAGSGAGASSILIPASTASVIREYISCDIIKACITSIHEPYFVELQRDLASVIATIVASYSRYTTTPRDVLMSLPNVNPAEVDNKLEFMLRKDTTLRQQRATVLDLLRDLKGVSISEMGKLSKSIAQLPPNIAATIAGTGKAQSTTAGGKRPTRSKMAQQFMTAQPPNNNIISNGNNNGPGGANNDDANGDSHLDGLANLFQ